MDKHKYQPQLPFSPVQIDSLPILSKLCSTFWIDLFRVVSTAVSGAPLYVPLALGVAQS
jgi:hypothetical protein